MSSRASTGASRASAAKAAKSGPKLTANGNRAGRPPKSEAEKAASAAAKKEKQAAYRASQRVSAPQSVQEQFASLTSKMNGAQDRADQLRRQSGAAQRAGNPALRDQLLQRAERVQNRYRALRSQRNALNYTPPDLRTN